MCNNLGSLYWLIINILFNSLLRNIIDLDFLSNVRNVFSDMFNLLIVSVNFFNWDVACLSDILIFSHRSSNWNIFNSLLWDLFDVLSFIRNLDIIDLLFIISISFLDWNVFNVRLILRLWLLIDCGWLLYNLSWLLYNLCWLLINLCWLLVDLSWLLIDLCLWLYN